MPPARRNLRRVVKAGKSAALYIAGALAGTGLYAANLAYLNAQAPATLIASLSVPGQLNAVALDPNGDILAAGGYGEIRNAGGERDSRSWTGLWNIADPARPVKVGQAPVGTRAVSRLAFTPDGHLATNDGNTVTLWDKPNEVDFNYRVKLTNPHHPSTAKGNTELVSKGQTPIFGDPDGSVTLWDAAHPGHTVTLSQPPASRTKDRIPSAAFTPNGKTLAYATGDGKVTLWNVANPARPVKLSQPPAISTKGDWVRSVAFFPNGKTLVTASNNNTVTLWNVDDPARPVKLSRPLTGTGTITRRKPHGYWIYSSTVTHTATFVAVSRDAKTLAIGQDNGTIALWNVTDPAQPVEVGQPIKAGQNVNSVAFTADGKTLITGTFNNADGADSKVKIWRL